MIDWFHRHPKTFIQLRQKVLQDIPSQRVFGVLLLDRDALILGTPVNQVICFWTAVARRRSYWKNTATEAADFALLINLFKDLPQELIAPETLKKVDEFITNEHDCSRFNINDKSFQFWRSILIELS